MYTKTAKTGREELVSYVSTSVHKCPMCQGTLVRTPRRMVDRLWSLVQPLERYRCERFVCQWVGNLVKPAPPPAGTQPAAPDLESPASSRVPASFIVHMVLAAIGLVAVVVFSNLDPTPLSTDAEKAPTVPFSATRIGWR